MEVIARINADSPAGRKLIRDLSRQKAVISLEVPPVENLEGISTLTHEEIWSKVEKKLNDHYGTNYKLNY